MDEATRGARTLVISTDPAPSLGDALGQRLTGSPRRVPLARGSLHALEVNSHDALTRWLRPRRRVLETIALRGTWLDERDVGELLRQSLPGIDEITALLEILRHGRTRKYDVIVVDTAPTGHTLRMLAMPGTLSGIARVFDHMQAKHRAMVEALRGVAVEDEADELISRLQQDALMLTDLLRNSDLMDVSLVTLPETLAVEETLDAARSLFDMEIPVAQAIVNRVTQPPPQKCSWCDARRRTERDAISVLAAEWQSLAGAFERPMPRFALVSEGRTEPIGPRALRRFAAELRKPALLPRRRRSAKPRGTAHVARLPERSRVAAPFPPVRLLMFGGKGGCGKTTCAAAAALQLARTQPRRRILLVSTDPAHSLADVLEAPVSDAPRHVSGLTNLDVRELDASGALESIRTRYEASVDAVFDRLARGSAVDLAHDRIVMHDLLDLAPPGLDELAAVLELVDLLGNDASPRKYDVIVMDTAPTGHAVRLLQMPEIVHEWIRMLMRILLKYQPVVGIGELGEALVRLSRGVGRLRAMLAKPAETQFVVVTRAAALPRAETVRLVRALRPLRIRVSAILVNAIGGGDCDRCRARARRQVREIDALVKLSRANSAKGVVMAAPATVPPPAGAPALEAWRGLWRAI